MADTLDPGDDAGVDSFCDTWESGGYGSDWHGGVEGPGGVPAQICTLVIYQDGFPSAPSMTVADYRAVEAAVDGDYSSLDNMIGWCPYISGCGITADLVSYRDGGLDYLVVADPPPDPDPEPTALGDLLGVLGALAVLAVIAALFARLAREVFEP